MAAPAFVPLALQLTGLVGGLFVGVLALPEVEFGLWPRVELPTVALWVAAGLCAAGLALDAPEPDRRMLRSPLVVAVASLVALSVLLAPLARHPWLSILGAPQGGEGGMRHLAFLVLLLSALRLRRVGGLRQFLVVAAAAAAAMAAFQAHADFGGGPLFVFREYLAYPAVALGAMAAAEIGRRRADGGEGRSLLPAGALVVALVVLALSTNRSAWLGAGGGAILATVVAARSAVWGFHSRPWRCGMAVALGLMPWVILAAVVLVGLDVPVESVRSRARVMAVLLDAVATSPSIWAVGAGWGHTTELFAMHLTAAPASLWDGSWDIATRDLFHSHHAGFEAFLALGVAGAALWTLALIAPVLMAPAAALPAAIFLAAALAVMDATWFQFPFATGALALATAWVIAAPADEPAGAGVRLPGARTAAAATAISLAVAAAFVAVWESRFAASHRALREDQPACAGFPDEAWRGDVELAYLFDQTLQAHRPTLRQPQPASDESFAPLAGLFCELDRRAAAGASPYLMIVGLLFRNEAAFSPGLPARLRSDLAADWEARVGDLLRVAPRRTDLAAPLLTAWLIDRQFARVAAFARDWRQKHPSDPVALYFAGVARLAAIESPRHRDEGIFLLREAARQGIERIIPLDPSIKNIISN